MTTVSPQNPAQSALTDLPKVTAPGQLAAIVPYQLGYVPRSSMVVLTTDEVQRTASGRLRFVTGGVGRVDVPPPGASDEAVDEAVGALLACIDPRDTAGVAVVLFGARQVAPGEHPRDPDAPLNPSPRVLDAADALATTCAGLGIPVIDELYVEDGRYLQLDCLDLGCCPPEGHPLPDPTTVGAVAHFVAAGAAPVDDRAQVVATCLAGSHPLAQDVERELARARREARSRPVGDRTLVRRWRDTLFAPAARAAVDPRDEGPLPSAATLARLVAELEVDDQPPGTALGAPVRMPRSLRDAVLGWCIGDVPAAWPLDPALVAVADELLRPLAPTDRAGLDALVRRLGELVRAVPPAACAPMSGLLATVAWHRGDPVRARAAAVQALDVDPDHRLAGLVLTALDHGVRPWTAPR